MLLRVQLDGQERRISVEELEEAVRTGRVGPETPLDTGEGWRPARDWREWDSMSAGPAARVRARWDDPPAPWATALVVGLCLRIFLWTYASPTLAGAYGHFDRNSPAIIEGREVWRLWTYGFFHSGLPHISMNMLLLAYVGLSLERLLRGREVLVVFFATVMGGALFSTYWSPQVGAIGASAADFGFMAATGALGLRWWEVLPRRARVRFGFVMVAYAAYPLINSIDAEGVDNMAHFGGLCVGALLGALYDPLDTRRNDRVSIAAIITMVGIAGVFVVGGPRLQPMTPLVDEGASTVRPAWWGIGWLPTGEQGWASPRKDAWVALLTEQTAALTDEAEVLDKWIAEVQELDAGAVAADEGPLRRVRYTSALGAREAFARAEVHGRHVSTVIVDVPAGDGRGDWLRACTEKLVVTPPESITTALSGADSPAWRLRMQAAEAAGSWGDEPRARELTAGVLRMAPEDPSAALAVVRLARRDGWSDVIQVAETNARRFPSDRALLAEQARALADAGRVSEAIRLVEDALTRAPGDVVLLRARAELGP